nr:Rpn family recombination-promoting nuclease/putative transposase [uncultured Acetatifactor sp.]
MDSKKDRLRSAKGQAVGIGQETKDEGTEGKGKDNTHNRDLNSKSIFDDPVLCAQFFRDNFDVSLLKEVQPEDIDDISERFLPYLGTELESDSVKKVRILDIGRKRNPPFFVSLIEHKSLVDYDVPMQLLRYMVCIWTEYRREKEAEKEGSTQRKGFRYPIIMPVVYYEGKARWTADMHLRNRIGDSLRRPEWIPDFRYEVIRIHDYSNQELLDREDEMSLIMLINQIPRCKQRGINLAALQSSGVFDPRGIRQMCMQACPLDSLLAGIKYRTPRIWRGSSVFRQRNLTGLSGTARSMW